MKTLDEVIKALEICHHIGNVDCSSCPYYPGKGWCEEKDVDALHYLKEYRKMTEVLHNIEETSPNFVCPKCHSEFIILPESNPPLTWDELKQMEGQPVWYEHEFWKGWIILGKVEQGVTCEMIPDQEERWYIVKDGSAKAYRKERS